MVGILLSYWGGLFSGAMLVSGRVNIDVCDVKVPTVKFLGRGGGVYIGKIPRWDLSPIVHKRHFFLHHKN